MGSDIFTGKFAGELDGFQTPVIGKGVLAESLPQKLGFKVGAIGTHSSRTIMLEELSALLDTVPLGAGRSDYWSAIIEQNALGKQTGANRKITAQHLTELYALEPTVPLFRVLRRFWQDDVDGRPVLAHLCSLARDPLLRVTAAPILAMKSGEELSRQKITDAIRAAVGTRMNDATLDKVVRNVSSSWTQSGHLRGRARKFRQLVRPTPLATAYALLLGYLEGLRGGRLFETNWTRVLDSSPGELRTIAAEAKRLNGLDLRAAGDVIEIGFATVLTSQEIKDSRVAH